MQHQTYHALAGVADAELASVAKQDRMAEVTARMNQVSWEDMMEMHQNRTQPTCLDGVAPPEIAPSCLDGLWANVADDEELIEEDTYQAPVYGQQIRQFPWQSRASSSPPANCYGPARQ